MFRKLHFTVQSNFKIKISSHATNKAAIEKSLEIANSDNYKRPLRLEALFILSQKKSSFFTFFDKTRANT